MLCLLSQYSRLYAIKKSIPWSIIIQLIGNHILNFWIGLPVVQLIVTVALVGQGGVAGLRLLVGWIGLDIVNWIGL